MCSWARAVATGTEAELNLTSAVAGFATTSAAAWQQSVRDLDRMVPEPDDPMSRRDFTANNITNLNRIATRECPEPRYIPP